MARSRKNIAKNNNKSECKTGAPATPPVAPELVIKSPLDKNDYLVIQLPNGLKAFLVSTIRHASALDEPKVNKKTGVLLEVEEFNRKFVHIPDEDGTCPDSDDDDWEPERKKAKVESKEKSNQWGLGYGTVCLSVGAGWLHDPPDFQGMAHICEHACVSFGSKRFPEPYTLGKKVESGFGYWNATTYPEFTTYYFKMSLDFGGLDNFKTALDVLADFIADPLIPADSLNREVHAVDSEFSLWDGHLGAEFWQLFDGTSRKNHPCHGFSCGNQETLGKPTLHSRLVEWKNRHYAANYTTVAISAALPLEDLEVMVRQYFGKIQPSSLPSPMTEIVLKNKGNPFATPEFSKLYKMVPTLDYQLAVFTFVVPSPDYINDYECKPYLYLRYFFDGDSLFMKFLARKGWALELMVSFGSQNGHRSFCSSYTIYMQLTDLGVKEFFEVIKSLFSYLRMIVELGAQEDIFDAIRREKADSFHYCPRHWLVDDLINAADLLLRLEKPKYIMTAGKLVTDYDPEFIEDFIKQLTPRNVNIIISSKSFEPECDKIEEILKTKYTVADFQEKFIRECENVKVYKEFEFPDKKYENPLRLKNIICPVGSLFGFQTLRDDSKGFIDFLKINFCQEGTVPTGVYYTFIDSPMIPKTETSRVLLYIWTTMFHDVLRKSIALSQKARIQSGLSSTGYSGQGILMYLYGPPFNFARLFKLYLATFLELDKFVTAKMFEDYKELHVKGYDNGSVYPFSYKDDLEEVILRQKAAIDYQRKVSASNLDFQDFKNFVCAFKDRMKFYILLIGCISDQDARDVTDFIGGLDFRGIPEDAFGHIPCRAIQLPLGKKCLRVKLRSERFHISVVQNHHQIGNVNYFQHMLVWILSQILRRPAFVQLRTAEQLSYSVAIYTSTYCGSLGLKFVVVPQAYRHAVDYVEQQISSFLKNFREKFGSLKTLQAEGIWPAWLSHWWHPTFVQIYDDFLLPTGKNFRKLSIQTVGTPKYPNSKPLEVAGSNEKIERSGYNYYEMDDDNPDSTLDLDYDIPDNMRYSGYFITDVESFKDSLFLNPNVDIYYRKIY